MNFDQGFVDDGAPISPPDFSPIPAGTYTACITGADWEVSKTSGTRMVKVELTITGPSHADRKVWWYANLEHPSAEARRISSDQMKALLRSARQKSWRHPSEMAGWIVTVKLGVQPPKGDYPAGNRVLAFVFDESATGIAAPVTAPAQPTQTAPPVTPQPAPGQAAPPAGNKPAWS